MLKQFKSNSHQKISDIKKQQAKHKRDIVQPRISGELNPEYIKVHGTKNLNISQHDVERMARKDRKFLKILNNKRRQQQNGNKM